MLSDSILESAESFCISFKRKILTGRHDLGVSQWSLIYSFGFVIFRSGFGDRPIAHPVEGHKQSLAPHVSFPIRTSISTN
jgi:hypothetical protein